MWPTIAAVLMALAVGFGAGEAWEHRPTHTPSVHVLFFHWTAPESLAAQRDAGRAGVVQCHANVSGLLKGIGDANAAVDAEHAQRVATLHELDKASSDALNARAVAESKAQTIMAMKPGGDVCKAAEAVLRGS